MYALTHTRTHVGQTERGAPHAVPMRERTTQGPRADQVEGDEHVPLLSRREAASHMGGESYLYGIIPRLGDI